MKLSGWSQLTVMKESLLHRLIGLETQEVLVAVDLHGNLLDQLRWEAHAVLRAMLRIMH